VAKPSDSRSSDRDKRPEVISSKGVRRRFLRGMIAHDLVQRGLSFDDAYAAAQAIRDLVEDLGEETVTTAEIRELIERQLEQMLGEEQAAGYRVAKRPKGRFVVSRGQKLPFSRGLLARSISAAGVDLDRAYRLVVELERELQADGTEIISSDEIVRRVGDLLERLEDAETAQRYRLVRRIRRLPRPLVIYLGGASGVGKSSLSLELAPLLRIYRINSTDTIRQMMRMVFSPQILPALHTSSFEAASTLDAVEDRFELRDKDAEQRLITGFEEQAMRVCVGVRAVVERAVAENMSILVEGVHLVPPLVPFQDLEGAAYQVPLILATSDAEAHRARFLSRDRLGPRRSERYLENFPAIRVIHEFILHQAEIHDVPLVETSGAEPPVARTVRLVTGMLQKRLPSLATPPSTEKAPPVLLVVVDGLADRPVRALGGRTPLRAAKTPTLDRLAREGKCGLADPLAPGVVPDTAAGTLALFGQSPLALKRGPVEALGAGIELAQGDVALRGNFATLDDNQQVVDRRAGRIRKGTTELAKALDRLTLPGDLAHDVEIRVKEATEHRLAIVLRGDGLSSAIRGSDPGDGAIPGPPLTPQPLDPQDERAVETARILALFEQKARKVLRKHPVNRARVAAGLPAANAVLTRGAGRIHRLIPLEEAGVPLRSTCISGDRTVLGLAGWLGAETVTLPSMTANLDTDLDAKFGAALEALRRSDLVMLHIKGADIAAHDQRPELKAGFLEKIDRHLAELLERHREPLRVAVASDHATLSESGQHAADPLPILIWGAGIEADEVDRFDETEVAGGDLDRAPLQLLLGRLFDLTD
jgi:2,3-bisphosphoglycerate-independent phosphoglycerate mutase